MTRKWRKEPGGMICHLREQVTLQVAASLGREWNSTAQARVKISFGASATVCASQACLSPASGHLLHFLIFSPQDSLCSSSDQPRFSTFLCSYRSRGLQDSLAPISPFFLVLLLSMLSLLSCASEFHFSVVLCFCFLWFCLPLL